MKKTIVFLLAAVAFSLGEVRLTQAAEPVPRCLRLFTADIEHLGWEEARRVFRAVKTYDAQGREGARLILLFRETAEDGAERLAQTLKNFRYELTVPNPYASDRELLAAIAELDRADPRMTNFGRVIGDLGQDNALGLSQAAAYDVYIAQDMTRAGLGVEGFQVELSAGGVTRVYDMRTKTGRYLENKSLVVPYQIAPGELTNPPVSADGLFFVYQDQRLNSLANETARSIVLHQPDGYQLFGTNFRNIPDMLAERGAIEEIMLKQFDSVLVKQALRDQVGAARDLFASQLTSILQFK
jgi:hypothetical protein